MNITLFWDFGSSVGLVFAARGAEKLFGVFGGQGIQDPGEFVEQIGLRQNELRAWYPGAAG